MIRVVLDTNVLISTALPGGRLNQLVNVWKNKQCLLLISPEIFDEYLRVFTYPKFRLSSEDIQQILETDVLPYAEFVEIKSKIHVIKTDPSDNKFLACAIDGKADYIVSGDQHLLTVKKIHKIPILTARQFLEKLTEIKALGKD